MKKKLMSLMLTVVMLCSMLVGTAGAVDIESFSDVQSSDWFYQYVDFVTSNEYFVGTSDTTFEPNLTMTRAMFVVVMARMDGAEVNNDVSSFSDVPVGTWYTGAVTWATENDLVLGVGNNQFDPNGAITREQMCVLMDRFVDYYGEKTGQTHETVEEPEEFPDADQISEYAVEAVNNCHQYGLITGFEDGTLRPKEHSTRAQVAAVIYRLSWFVDQGGTDQPGGNTGGIGGDPGGSNPPPGDKDKNYLVKASLSFPKGILETNQLDLTASYTVSSSGSGDQTVAEILPDLISGENEQSLKNAIQVGVGKLVKKSPYTLEVKGETMQVTIDEDGKISATSTMNSILANTNTRAVTTDAILALVEKLQKGDGDGDNLVLTADDLESLNYLMGKANDIVTKMSDKEIQDMMDDFIAQNPGLEQAAAGLTVENIKEAAGTYGEQLEALQNQIKDVGQDDGSGNISIPAPEPIVMTVKVDLGQYLAQIMDSYEGGKEARIQRVLLNLYPELAVTDEDTTEEKTEKEEQLAALENSEVGQAVAAIYDANNPENFIVDNEDGTLSLKTADEYYAVLSNDVNATCGLWTALGEDEVFYQGLIDRAEAKLDKVTTGGESDNTYDITLTLDEDLAAMLADKDGILKENAGSTVVSAQYTADEDDLTDILDRLIGSFSGDTQMGGLSNMLNRLIGTYDLTVTIKEIKEVE